MLTFVVIHTSIEKVREEAAVPLLHPPQFSLEWRFVVRFASCLDLAATRRIEVINRLRNLLEAIDTLDLFPELRDRLRAAGERVLEWQATSFPDSQCKAPALSGELLGGGACHD